MTERWSFYIDVEGFRSFLADDKMRAVRSLGELMRAIFRVGRNCYPDEIDRICAHQFGDGFIVIGDHHEQSLDRCVAIAVAVMRHVAASGAYTKTAIAEGDLADVQGWYPDEVLACRETEGHRISMHMGLMTITSVMGTALTRTVRLGEAEKGPLLLVPTEMSDRIDESIPRRPLPKRPEVTSVDWVHMESPLLEFIQATAGLDSEPPRVLEENLTRYCGENSVGDRWRSSVRELLGVASA